MRFVVQTAGFFGGDGIVVHGSLVPGALVTLVYGRADRTVRNGVIVCVDLGTGEVGVAWSPCPQHGEGGRVRGEHNVEGRRRRLRDRRQRVAGI